MVFFNSLPTFLLKFTFPYVLVRCVVHCAEATEKLRQYGPACELLAYVVLREGELGVMVYGVVCRSGTDESRTTGRAFRPAGPEPGLSPAPAPGRTVDLRAGSCRAAVVEQASAGAAGPGRADFAEVRASVPTDAAVDGGRAGECCGSTCVIIFFKTFFL